MALTSGRQLLRVNDFSSILLARGFLDTTPHDGEGTPGAEEIDKSDDGSVRAANNTVHREKERELVRITQAAKESGKGVTCIIKTT